ncbi:unnamed protein product [Owenia fusiformis]|uniref:ATP-binding cassette sub-family B member 10, mitochondrial n=1 Tax=Owenia fusiformis TaxID=6347 RepID=A0A8J1U4N7_OWEFU|nr:unnamed protein product [Owenia fusiformis]
MDNIHISGKNINVAFWEPILLVRFQYGPGNGKISKPSKREVRRLLSLARPEWLRLGGAVGLLVISSGVTMAVPFCIGKVIDIIYDSGKDGNMVEKLTSFCQVLVGVFLVGAVANAGRVYLMSTSGQRIVKTLREKIFGSIMAQEVAFFDKTRTGELINRLSTDTTLVGQSVTMNISDGLRSFAQGVGGIGMMFYVSPKLATIGLTVVPAVAVVAIFYGRYLRSITKQVQDALAKSTEIAEERISNVRTVRAFAKEDREIATYTGKIEDVLQLSYKDALARGVFFGFTGLAGNLIVLTVFYNGGLMMNESALSVGDLSAFLLYAAYVGVAMGGLTSFYSELMKGLGASTRLWELIDRAPAIPLTAGYSPSTEVQGGIQFQNVSFSYPARSDIPILEDLNLSVPAGKILAVVGPSGSGKSTIASLILRFYDPNSGMIQLDGKDVNSLSPSWLRSNIGTVSQEPILFSSSIADNIRYGSNHPEDVTFDEIQYAAKQSNSLNFIEAFPEKFNTMVGERGVMLSGGQRQRIALARAILKNPKILLLDEATSALDAESEHLVQEALERLMVGRTVITIAHRLSTIKNAHNIAVLDDGKVIEIGSYTDLMAIEDGMFRKLVERQTIMQ